jgi:DeoR family ulaG and ulaABCDEF operon transcriptional repressor
MRYGAKSMSREISPLHAQQREAEIIRLLQSLGFISFKQLCQQLEASTATIRRDLDRLAAQGVIDRVRGGARLKGRMPETAAERLAGTPFEQNRLVRAREKAAIGRAAAELCGRGEAVIIDGGTTTFQMCKHLAGRELQVLTNSLHIVNELLPQSGTRVSVPGGAIFREQNIILSPFDEDGISRYHASKLFMGAAAVGARGLMQADVVLIQAEQKLMHKADKLIVLVDSSKLRASASFVVCPLEEIDILVTDNGAKEAEVSLFKSSGIEVIIAR